MSIEKVFSEIFQKEHVPDDNVSDKEAVAIAGKELSALQSFKQSPYFQYLAEWITFNEQSLLQVITNGEDSSQVFKASGGLKLIGLLKYQLNREEELAKEIGDLKKEKKPTTSDLPF